MSKVYDITIIGAGPAGANLARLVGQGYKVLLIDKRNLNESNYKAAKCCGGLLAPDSQKMIASLGLGIPKDILVDPQLFAVRTIDLSADMERLYQRHYYNMDREKFDRWLVSLIPDRVDKRFDAVIKGFEKTQEGYEIRYVSNGKEEVVHTQILVGADGANSKVRRLLLNDKSTIKTYVAIQEWFESDVDSSYYTAIFDPDTTDFYSWIIPKDNYLILGSALKPNDNTVEKFELLKEKLGKRGLCFDKKVRREGAFILRPGLTSNVFAGKENIVLIGEAAGAISPSSAEGISYALRTSHYLAESLNAGLDDFLGGYKRRLASIKANILIKNLKCPFMYNSILRYMAMKSGFMSIRDYHISN